MAELMFDSVDLRRADGSVMFYISTGWVDSPADVRGVDTIVPGLSGRTRRPRRTDIRTVIMNGLVVADTPEALLELQLELVEVWAPGEGVADLVVGDQYLGLAPGETATLVCSTTNLAVGDAETAFMRRYSWQLESVDNPPEWVFSGSSSL